MRLFLVLGVAATLLLSPCAPADAAAFSDIFVFGNSLSDNGNVFAASFSLLPGPLYYEGRFSNGPVYAEVLADLLGLGPLQPVTRGGTNYAWGGALSGTDIPVGVLTLPSVRSQVIGFLASLEGGAADADALYIVSAGANDIREAVANGLDGDSGAGAMTAAAGAIVEAVLLLSDVGAVHILVIDAPDLGATPGLRGNEAATALSQVYNRALDAGLEGRSVIRFDLSVARSAEGALGLLDEACLIGETVCDNPDDYLFFDDLHPTAVVHALLAGLMQQALDAPTTVAALSWGQLKADAVRW